METWEQWVLGAVAVVLLILFWPGLSKRLRDSPKGTREDWMGLALPIAAVVGFVLLLIALV